MEIKQHIFCYKIDLVHIDDSHIINKTEKNTIIKLKTYVKFNICIIYICTIYIYL